MLHIVLFNPEIPPNTGNVIRLCANTGFQLHLIEPLGFVMEDKKLRRAGLDYHEWASVNVHDNWQAFIDAVQPARIFACETTGQCRHVDARFAVGDALVFGPETGAVPAELMSALPPEQTLRLPMRPGQRSLNLSNAVAVIAFEAWRQLEFSGAS
ncbi:tRNA (uridine(34)/cytosine(34)/5-carboxymethylaminomethyluridine(34)-2'-O)-methyltransferase TrmL [Permianibacter sp. IMCC34836]|uniref:tRNA (uridine(34)/cytosine(34)/5- carboxymethylaminomethyluridine(34)-2'-O)- methyltransferase TrmL n=1 Tax=Permianibacter fluminis TaxID=2738515 RepID=UPI00155171CA|nr:tRNA (uridine(34)/cytosine(34)/5-carboxymethylaminomethyluridine(34)-2'-O)-methyltransferase TrmL [Permianibacter fluminis]NQD36187.1 tRNA (uridine(34)/cytosine(34)/5-carboxymethylaminomethyluridine(34)-2'-O)-methyltransferase TrmL [Permianibacter fluminis]